MPQEFLAAERIQHASAAWEKRPGGPHLPGTREGSQKCAPTVNLPDR